MKNTQLAPDTETPPTEAVDTVCENHFLPATLARECIPWRTMSRQTVAQSVEDTLFARALGRIEFGFGVAPVVNNIKITSDEVDSDIDLVVRSGVELGQQIPMSKNDIFERAASLGFGLTPKHAALQMRHTETLQPGQELVFASAAIEVDPAFIFLMSMEAHGVRQRLLVHPANGPYLWNPRTKWVFAL